MLTHAQVELLILNHFPEQQVIPRYWDSLKHLEIITDMEKKLDVKFILQEIIETHNNLELLISLLLEKSCS